MLLLSPQAFANKNYPVECNQSQWISQLVDFYVDSIVNVTEVRACVLVATSDKRIWAAVLHNYWLLPYIII